MQSSLPRITYYHVVQNTCKKIPEDCCFWKKCENVKLMLLAMKSTLKNKLNALGSKFKPNIGLLIATLCVQWKTIQVVMRCANLALMTMRIENSFSQLNLSWKICPTRNDWKEMACMQRLKFSIERDLTGKTFRIHMDTIYRQYSELQYLKKNLKWNKVILLGIDFC